MSHAVVEIIRAIRRVTLYHVGQNIISIYFVMFLREIERLIGNAKKGDLHIAGLFKSRGWVDGRMTDRIDSIGVNSPSQMMRNTCHDNIW